VHGSDAGDVPHAGQGGRGVGVRHAKSPARCAQEGGQIQVSDTMMKLMQEIIGYQQKKKWPWLFVLQTGSNKVTLFACLFS
jgi:hypothetical protein